MSMQDPIADMLTRIRNAHQRMSASVLIPASKVKMAIAKVLKEEGYIDAVEDAFLNGHPAIKIQLKYYKEQPVIETIQRVSKSSLRVYKTVDELKKFARSVGVKNGMGIAIVSTSSGVMTHQSAIKQSKGGEVLCFIN